MCGLTEQGLTSHQTHYRSYRGYGELVPVLIAELACQHKDAMHRGGCLELYYCNTVEWCWWDSSQLASFSALTLLV